MPVYKHVHGVTEKQWAEWRNTWEADRERWAKTYVPGAYAHCRAPSSINTLNGNNKP